MSEDMVTVNGIRYRREDLPRHKAILEPETPQPLTTETASVPPERKATRKAAPRKPRSGGT